MAAEHEQVRGNRNRRRKPGFGWALLCSVMIHITLFLTVPLGGPLGAAREEAVRRVTKTAVEFVTYVKPPPPPPPSQPRITQQRIVRRVVRRPRRVRRAPRRRPPPAAPQTQPEAELSPAAPEPAPEIAPVPEPEPAPELAVMPPEAEPAPEPVAMPAPEPAPEPVIIHPTPAAADEPAPAVEPQLASAPSFESPKAAPEGPPAAPSPLTGPAAPPPGPERPAPVAAAPPGGGRAEGPETPGPLIAFAPSTAGPSAEAPGRPDAAPVDGEQKLAPAMGGAPSEAPGAGGARSTAAASGRAREGSGPVFVAARSAGGGPAGSSVVATQLADGGGAAERVGAVERPGPSGDGGPGRGGAKAAPARLAGAPRPSGSGTGAGTAGKGLGSDGSGTGGPVAIASAPPGGGPAWSGSPGGGGAGGGGAAGAGGGAVPGGEQGGSWRSEAPSGGGGGGGGEWVLVKAAPGEWQIVATAPGTGGVGPGGGQGGEGGMGTGTGGGIGASEGPSLGPLTPVEVPVATAVGVPAPLQDVVPGSLWGSLLGAFGLVGAPGGGAVTPTETWEEKLVPMVALHDAPGGTGAGAGVTGGSSASPAGQGADGMMPGQGGPVAIGLPGAGGDGGAGLPPLPALDEELLLASAPDARPGPGALGLGFGLDALKSTPGGLYTNISGSFDMPMGVTTADYQADAQGMLNLLSEVRGRTKVRVTVHERYVPLTLENIRHSPVLHLRGHRAFTLTEEERETLRRYVAQGGTIFGEDSHGPFGECFQREMIKTFGKPLSDLSIDHEVYRAHYVLDRVPAGDMGERYPLQGIDAGDGRLGVIFSRNDYGDCWEGTGEWVRPESREPAFRMGVNIFTYVVAQWQRLRDRDEAQ